MCVCVCEGWRLTLGSHLFYLSAFVLFCFKLSLPADLEIPVSTDGLPSKLPGSAHLCLPSPGPHILNGRGFTHKVASSAQWRLPF